MTNTQQLSRLPFVINREALQQIQLNKRISMLEAKAASEKRDAALEALYSGKIPRATLTEAWMKQNVRPARNSDKGTIAEFIGTGDIQRQWFERQRYEVEAGRDEEPLLFPAIYNVITDESLPRTIDIYSMGPAGVFMEEVTEGGEVKFASMNTRNKSVTIAHYAVGLEYTEDIMIYNELWKLPLMERQFGIANNALQNHAHMSPILGYNYTGSNITNGTALTNFRVADELPNKYMRTLETAISTASSDPTNPRRGPYVILCASADQFTIERALGRVPQQGFDASSSTRDRVRNVVVYDGWTGVRGNKTSTYAGATAGTAYLIDLSHRNEDFQSFFKHQLRRQMDNGELTRFIMERVVWDVRFGLFADPLRSVHKITLPLTTSGQA